MVNFQVFNIKIRQLNNLDFKSVFLQIHFDVFHSESFSANRALQDQSVSFEETEARARGGVSCDINRRQDCKFCNDGNFIKTDTSFVRKLFPIKDN